MKLRRPRLVERRERAIDDEDVGMLHEAPDEIDARPLLRGEKPSGRPDLMTEADPLDGLVQP